MSILYSLICYTPVTAVQGVPGAGKTYLQALAALTLVGVAHEPVLMLASQNNAVAELACKIISLRVMDLQYVHRFLASGMERLYEVDVLEGQRGSRQFQATYSRDDAQPTNSPGHNRGGQGGPGLARLTPREALVPHPQHAHLYLCATGLASAEAQKVWPALRFRVPWIMRDEAQMIGRPYDVAATTFAEPEWHEIHVGDPCQPAGASPHSAQQAAMRVLETHRPGINSAKVRFYAPDELYAKWLDLAETTHTAVARDSAFLRNTWLDLHKRGPLATPRIVAPLQMALHLTRRHDPTYGQWHRHGSPGSRRLPMRSTRN